MRELRSLTFSILKQNLRGLGHSEQVPFSRGRLWCNKEMAGLEAVAGGRNQTHPE